MKLQFVIFNLFLLSASFAQAAYTVHDGKLMNVENVATLSVQDHYTAGLEAYQTQQWPEALRQMNIVVTNFSETPFYQEAIFYIGAINFHLGEYELANKKFNSYLKKQTALSHFREAIEFKFQIAEMYKNGAKRHMMGLKALPKWIPAQDEALRIYDEVITALPNDPLAAQALFGKALLQLEEDDYAGSIETHQTLIRRFPKHVLAPDAYVQIAQVYLKQAQDTYPDIDYLDLAEINLKKFRQDFPSDDRVALSENYVEQMREIYGNSLYEIGQFFERTKKPHAAVIYYTKIAKTYPKTVSAEHSRRRLAALQQSPELSSSSDEQAAESTKDNMR